MATGEQHSAESERFRAPPPQGVRSFAMYGEAWTVYEATDPTSLARVLIFEGVKTARRVREFPLNWRDLTDEDLFRVSWSR